jgi:tetratricopeptide (TPR) repeat protein
MSKIVFICCTLAFGQTAAGVTDSEARTAYLQARTLIDDGPTTSETYRRASALLTRVLELDPQFALAWVQRARIAYKSGYISYDDYRPEALRRAHRHLDEAARLDPDLFSVHVIRAYVLMFQGKLGAARAQAERAKRLKPTNLEISVVAADLLLAQLAEKEKDHETAVRLANRIADSDAPARLRVEGLDCFQRTLHENPRHAAAHYGVGAYHLHDAKLDSSFGHTWRAWWSFRRAAALEPSNELSGKLARYTGRMLVLIVGTWAVPFAVIILGIALLLFLRIRRKRKRARQA